MSPAAPNRRSVLTAIGAGLATAACTSREVTAPPPTRTAGSVEPDCVLSPEGTEGPFYLDNNLLRGDIREDRAGVPLELGFAVVDATTCGPLADATVDIWHADAHGAYSGVGSDEDRFLRGIQRTDRSGAAEFTTIFPGWYDNRTVHIHVKVHVGGNEVHTGQLYFPDDVATAVAAVPPYAGRTDPRTDNEHDFLFGRAGDRSTLAVTGRPESGYRSAVTLGVAT